ncbi:MAG: biopolymer transporter ExbD [Verrucomicrobia bacterium]|jgi:biopolymer transport protein ExbD|nr:biopolymer transporter ExbD [Verrucomicrobiota bacterium]
MQAEGKSYDDINVTPMVDLYLVLLLIFIIMTTAGVQGIKVDLPKGSKQPAELTGPKGKAVTVNNEGKIFLDTVPVTLQELEQRLSEHKAKNPDFPIVVRGDRATQYQGIMDVLEVIGRQGLSKVGLVTQPPK